MMGRRPVTRHTLILALSDCAATSVKTRVRRFLTGLSSDELQFIAGFLGGCILERSEDTTRAAESLRMHRIFGPGARRCDQENKIILLREFLQVSGRRPNLPEDAGPAAA